MPLITRPVAALLAAALLLGAALLHAPAAHADAWQGPGVQLQINPQQPDQAQLTLNGRAVPATVSRGADGSVTGSFAFGTDRHTYTLTAPGPNGQRTFRVGEHTATLTPVQAAVPQPRNPAAPAGTLRLKRHTLVDKGMRNMPSHTVLVPDGWKVEGGGWWIGHQNFFNVLPSQEIKVTAPDGAEVEIGPEISFKYFRSNPATGLNMPPQQEGSADGGYPVMDMPMGPDGWRQWITTKGMPQAYPDATNVRVIEVAAVPELYPVIQQIVRPMQQMIAQDNQMNQMYGMPGGSFADGAFYASHVTFDRNGRSWEQLSIVGVWWLGSDFEVGRQLWWSAFGGRSYTVPLGELQQRLPAMVAIADSVQMTHQWSQMKSEHAAKMSGISAAGAAKRAEITRQGMDNVRKTNQQTSDIVAGTYDVNSGMSAQRKLVNSIHEVDDYTDSYGDTVQLPSGFEKAYDNGRGEIIMTNDVLNHPNTQNLGLGDWNEMNMRR